MKCYKNFIFISVIVTISLLACGTSRQKSSEEQQVTEASKLLPSNKTPTVVIYPTTEQEACIEFLESSQLRLKGFTILSDNESNLYYIDMESMSIYKYLDFPAKIVFSTDSSVFAYTNWFDEEKKILTVRTVDETINLQWEDNWDTLVRWLDNENIQINESKSPTTSQIILNPFENKSKRLVSDFPDIYSLDPKVNWEGLSLVSYSSNLRFAVYPRLSDDLSLVLIPTYQNGLVSKLYPVDIKSYPQWSAFGTFIIGKPLKIDEKGWLKGYELFEVGLGGSINQLTNFSEKYEYPHIENYRWSPNYENISFWFRKDYRSSVPAYLGVKNLLSQKTNLTCIKNNDFIFTTPPVWSPDSNYLIISTNQGVEKERLVIIDVINSKYQTLNFEFQLAPIGWIIFKP